MHVNKSQISWAIQKQNEWNEVMFSLLSYESLSTISTKFLVFATHVYSRRCVSDYIKRYFGYAVNICAMPFIFIVVIYKYWWKLFRNLHLKWTHYVFGKHGPSSILIEFIGNVVQSSQILYMHRFWWVSSSLFSLRCTLYNVHAKIRIFWSTIIVAP